jgi:hypothetical protein
LAQSAPLGAAPSDHEVERAVDQLAKDPNLAEERTIRMLSFGQDDKPSERKERNGFFEWVADFFGWFSSGARWLFWLLIGGLVVLLVFYLARLFTERRSWSSAARALAPTHVQDLDIRPESLPDDVGGAARALWDQGQRRAALSLLYRGLLSRLVHVYEVEIRASSTEGDCLELAARRLTVERLDFAARLIRVWQRAVYGGVEPSDETVHQLCAEFAFALDVPKTAAGHAAPEAA